jgi:DNA damage-binding protein 1
MNLLMNLQSNMIANMVSPGGIDFNKYRAYQSQVREEDEPKRFVDGELIERYLDCTPEEQETYVKGLMDDGRQITAKEVKEIVENLKRLH